MLIGLSGKLQSGKDTVAEYLIKKYNFNRLAFADKLKEMARDLFLWNGEKDAYGRKLLQDVGMKMREIKDDVWINYILRKIDTNKNYIITDVRYQNEANSLLKFGAILWRIERNLKRQDETNKHQSEIDLDDYKYFNHIIHNNSTIDDLYVKVDELLKGDI